MKRLISTLNLSKEDWLRYRKCGITGTDAGAILGVNPYRSAFQVYCDKNSETIENIDNEAMRQGRDLEDYVAQRFTEATGLKVRRANAIYQSEEHPLLLADFDRLIVGQKAGLECKTVSPFSADKWADGKIPAHYMAQVNHYLGDSQNHNRQRSSEQPHCQGRALLEIQRNARNSACTYRKRGGYTADQSAVLCR